MSTPGNYRGPYGFRGGLNTKAGPWTLGKDQMTDAQSVFVKYDVLFKMNGSATINSSALNSSASIIGLTDWQAVNQNRYVIIIAGSKIYRSQNLGNSPTDITGAASITAGNNNQHTFASLNNILAICGGSDTPLQWTGSGNVSSLAGSPPVGNIVTVANNFMFISGNTTNPSRIWWSNASDPNTWTASNNVDFRNSDGDIVTAIAPMNYNLIVFKRRSTGIFYTQTNTVSGAVTLGPLTQINVGMGCAGSQAWDVLPDGRLAVFGIDAHLRLFDGANFIDISDPPPPQSNIQPALDNLNISRLQYAVVRVYPALKQIWLAASTGSNTTNDTIYIYDFELGAWQCSVPDRPTNVMATVIDTRASPIHPIVLLNGDYGGFVYEQDRGSTNAQNADGHINGYATVSIAVGVEPEDYIPVSVRVSQTAQTSGQLQVGYGFNDLNTIQNTTILPSVQSGNTLDQTFVLDQSNLAGSAYNVNEVNLNSTGRVYTVQLQFLNPYASQPFAVHPFYLSEGVIA